MDSESDDQDTHTRTNSRPARNGGYESDEACSETMHDLDATASPTCTQPRNKETMTLKEFSEYCCVRKKTIPKTIPGSDSSYPVINMTYLISELPKISNSNAEDVSKRHGEATLYKSHIEAILSVRDVAFPAASQYHVMSFAVISPPIEVSESDSEPRQRTDMRGLHLLDRHISVNDLFQLTERSSRGDSGSILFSKSSGLVMDDLLSAVYEAANHTRGNVVIAFNREKQPYTVPTDLIRFLTTDKAEGRFAVSFVDPVLTSDWCVMVYWPYLTQCVKRTPIIGWPGKMRKCRPVLSKLPEAVSASRATEDLIWETASTLVAEYIKSKGNRVLNQRVSNAVKSLAPMLDNTPSSGKRTRSRLSSGAPAASDGTTAPPRTPQDAGSPSRAKAARVERHGAPVDALNPPPPHSPRQVRGVSSVTAGAGRDDEGCRTAENGSTTGCEVSKAASAKEGERCKGGRAVIFQRATAEENIGDSPPVAALLSRVKAKRVDPPQRTALPSPAHPDPSPRHTSVPRSSGVPRVSFRNGGRQGAGSDSGGDGGGASEEDGSEPGDEFLTRPLATPEAPPKDAQRLALDTLKNLVNPLCTARGDLNASEARALRLRKKLISLAAEKSAHSGQLTENVSEIQMKTRDESPNSSQMISWGMEMMHMEKRCERLLAMAQAASRAAAATDCAEVQEAVAAMAEAEVQAAAFTTAQAAVPTLLVSEELMAQFAKDNSEDAKEGRRLQDRIDRLSNVLDAVLSQRARFEALDKQRAAAEKAARDCLAADRARARALDESITADKLKAQQALAKNEFPQAVVFSQRAANANLEKEEIDTRCQHVEQELEGVLYLLAGTDAGITAAGVATATAARGKAAGAASQEGGDNSVTTAAATSVKVKEERNGD